MPLIFLKQLHEDLYSAVTFKNEQEIQSMLVKAEERAEERAEGVAEEAPI